MAGSRSKRDDLLLGLVPLVVALVLGVLLLPRRAVPDEIPAPVPDGRALARVEADDARRASEPLPSDVRELGSAVRTFNVRQAKQTGDPKEVPVEMNEARVAIDRAIGGIEPARRDEALLALRATQLEGFVREVRAFERTGNESDELVALAGPFVRRMRDVGWCSGHALAPDLDVLRVMFKSEWAAVVGVEREPFLPTLDEARVLYAFYLRHPHAPPVLRRRLDDSRAATKDPAQCAAFDQSERQGAEQWRIDKIRKLRAIDPAYPAAFALGVALYHHGDYPASAQYFHDWIDAHPDGPWTLRARGFLREAVYQSGL